MNKAKGEGMITTKKKWYKIGLEYYTGSLDFPCDFCESNSYKNYHINHDGVIIVICEDCLKKAKAQQSTKK